jgi:hypothetical protein
MTSGAPPDQGCRNLSTLLARGYLRLLEASRQSAVSCGPDYQNRLDVPALPRPDERVVRDARRAS